MKKTNETGITLITLVIVIILLVILGGVTISSLTGDNGIIKKAVEAKDLTQIATGKEKLQTMYMEYQLNENESVTLDKFLGYLEENQLNTKTENNKNYVEVDGKIYELIETSGGIEIEYVENGKITMPQIAKIEITNQTRTSVAIRTIAYRMDGGTYYYYIGEDENSLTTIEDQNTTGEYTFNNLTQGTTYYIKVEAENVEGEKTSKIIKVELDAIPAVTEENIEYEITWNGDGTATLELTTELTLYEIQTSIDKNVYEYETTRTGLQSGNIVYVRYADGEEYGKEMAIEIKDEKNPNLEVEINNVTTSTIQITAKATDEESGIDENAKYKYYIAETQEGLTQVEGENTTGEYLFENRNQNTTYYIKVEIEDRAGNKQEEIITVQTKLIPEAEKAIIREIKWNSDGTAKVSLSTSEEFKIVYKTDLSGTWKSYTEEVQVNNGQTIYVCLTDGRNYGEYYGILVQDNAGPEVKVLRKNTTTNKITVEVEAEDTNSGVAEDATYTYYIKKEGEKEYGEGVPVQSNEYTFENLTAQTTYNIKVEVSDIIGNKGEGSLNATTVEFEYVKGNITFENTIWENKEAKVTVNNNTEYQMQYQVVQDLTQIDTNSWITVTEKAKEVTKLKDGDIIVARLYDGTNVTEYATQNIEDNTAPNIKSVEGNPEEWTKQNVTLTINAEDLESGLQVQAYSFDNGISWQESNTKTYDANTTGIIIKVRDEAGNISTYDPINITKIDKTGPTINVETKATSNTITVTVTANDGNGVGLEITPTYRYKIAKTQAELETVQAEESTETTKQFINLEQDTTYYVRIEVEDKLGNITKRDETVTTGALQADGLTISEVTWLNKKAEVIIQNTDTQYKIQYQVIKSGGTLNPSTGWETSEETEVIVSDLLDGDKVYARLTDGNNYSGIKNQEIEDTTLPSITSVTGNPKDWTNQNVTLTVNAEDLESGLQVQAYSFDNGVNWQEQNTKEYTENTSNIIIKVRDEAGNIETYDTINITKIDKTGPNILIEQADLTTRLIKVEVTATDTGVGMEETPTYTYTIKEKGKTEPIDEKTTTETSKTFDKLTSNTTYEITVKAKDKLNNEKIETTEITTKNLLYQADDITFTDLNWSNSTATVTATNKRTDLYMQYQIATKGEDINLTGTWTDVKEQTIEIGNLKDGYIIYARLTDGVNSTATSVTGFATCIVNNSSKKTYTEDELAGVTRAEYDTLGISVANNEIKVQISEEQENASLYNYYYKTINDDEYTLISTSSKYNDPAVITGIQEGAVYKIKVLVTDKDGEVTKSENTATTIALGQAQAGQTYTGNRTYIDNSKQIQTVSGETIKAGYTVSLPQGFEVSETDGENKLSEGVVLKDTNQNEYVWIPVNDAIYDGKTLVPDSTGNAKSRTYKPMAKVQDKYTNYYESIIYEYNGSVSYRNTGLGLGKSGAREPSIITGIAGTYSWDNQEGVDYDAQESYYKDILGFETRNEFGEYLATSYTNMVTSVDSYGGFYVGRYETTAQETNGNVVVGSKANSEVLSNKNWYQMYLYQDSQRYSQNPYSSLASVKSSMIWGSQYDSMLNYILKMKESNILTIKTGNRTNTPHNSKQDETDKVNNIYDLGANLYEWTQEANGTENRIYRGGNYDTSTSKTIATRSTTRPTDQGPALGTRLGLYMQSTNDQTGPSVKINSVSQTEGTITVNVTATDKETGVSKYRYSISTNGGETFEVKGEVASNTYTYDGLTHSTKYVIKVEAIDGAGNAGEAVTQEVTTNKLEIDVNSVITVTQKYGSTGSGVIRLELNKEYVDRGFYIEYQIGTTEGEWTKGDTVTGLSNGQIIYATISDGTNRIDEYKQIKVEGLEEYAYYEDTKGNTSENKTVEYTKDGKTAWIPAGFKVGTTESVNNIDNGLVIQDAKGNEFVWVPVEQAIENSDSTKKPLARYQKDSTQYFEGVLYNFSGTTSSKISATTVLGTNGKKEPSLATNGADYTWNIANGKAVGQSYDTLENYYKFMDFGTNSGVNVFDSYTEFGLYMNEQYTNMVKSVDKYGGFYIARYETSTENNVTTKDAVVQSKIDQDPRNAQNWYKEYYYQDSNINNKNPYYTSTSVTSSMIWGSQWDAVLNWMLEDENTKEFPTKIAGNHTDAVSKTGQYSDDMAKNIFDMSSNVAEWTQESEGTNYRNYRGGFCENISGNHGRDTASSRINDWRVPTVNSVYVKNGQTTTTKNYLGSRMSLYITDGEDNTPPEVTIKETTKQTNQIQVTVDAKDEESGIKKYEYSISEIDFKSDNFEEDKVLQKQEAYGQIYTFTGLTQGQTYYVRVKVTNGANKTAETYTTQGIITDVLEAEEGAIKNEKVYGESGSGTAYFTINSETGLEEQGYYLEHQITKTGEPYNASGTFTKGDRATGLSVGDTVYTRLSDGKNISEYYLTTNITELETFTETYKTTEKYEDKELLPSEDGTYKEKVVGTAWIPAGFKRATSSITNKIKNGLVIKDEQGNEYVWIPVENAIYDGTTQLAQSGNSSTYKPFARYQNNSDEYYEGVLYNYSGTRSYVISTSNLLGTANNREPSLVTNSPTTYSWVYNTGDNYDATLYNQLSELGINSATKMGEYINDQYTDIVKSIAKYGGFYVGRYETSLYTESGQNSTNGTVVKSVANQEPMASVNWYKMYLSQDSNYEKNPYKTSTSVSSSMIWGSQWDAMLNYILQGTDKDKVTAITGNHTGNRSKTGQFGNDIMNNIFDLSSNVREWTVQANSTLYRVARGGFYNIDGIFPASNRNNDNPSNTYYYIGSRLALYVK